MKETIKKSVQELDLDQDQEKTVKKDQAEDQVETVRDPDPEIEFRAQKTDRVDPDPETEKDQDHVTDHVIRRDVSNIEAEGLDLDLYPEIGKDPDPRIVVAEGPDLDPKIDIQEKDPGHVIDHVIGHMTKRRERNEGAIQILQILPQRPLHPDHKMECFKKEAGA